MCIRKPPLERGTELLTPWWLDISAPCNHGHTHGTDQGPGEDRIPTGGSPCFKGPENASGPEFASSRVS
jgi:hypothetical protein